VKAPISHQGYESAWSQYSVQTPNRDQVQKALAQFGIPTHIHYPNILPQLPAFAPHGARLKKMKIHWPCAEDVSKQVLSLPMHSRLQKADIEQVVQALSLAHAQ